MPVEGSFQKAAMIAVLQQNMRDPANKVNLLKGKTILISWQVTYAFEACLK
jgi:hypothetical protein